MVFSGLSPNGRLVEIAELRDHPFMLGSQFHPEFKSRPNRPHPLFNAFLKTAVAETAQTDHHKTMLRALRIARFRIQVYLCAIFTDGRFYLLPKLLPHSL
jgi:hypothetical protein